MYLTVSLYLFDFLLCLKLKGHEFSLMCKLISI